MTFDDIVSALLKKGMLHNVVEDKIYAHPRIYVVHEDGQFLIIMDRPWRLQGINVFHFESIESLIAQIPPLQKFVEMWEAMREYDHPPTEFIMPHVQEAVTSLDMSFMVGEAVFFKPEELERMQEALKRWQIQIDRIKRLQG